MIKIAKYNNFHQKFMSNYKHNIADEFFENEVPQWITEGIDNDHFDFDPILENLQSHDCMSLFKRIKKQFPIITDFEKVHQVPVVVKDCIVLCTDYVSPKNVAHVKNEINELVQDDNFQNICKFYGYTISQHGFDRTNEIGYVVLEPEFPESAKYYIDNYCHGTVYHITTKQNASIILKTGLRCKHGRNNNAKYRVFPKRIYAYAYPPETPGLKNKLIKMAKNMLGLNEDDVSILKCDVNGDLFYWDSASEQSLGQAVFTYNNIPAENITVL